jgi:type IX secretion system PorP/SprF family membrane protein
MKNCIHGKLKHKLVAFGVGMLITMNLSAQQKVQFTQYMFNYFILNPAYAGADESLNLTFLNRSQWVGIDGAPVTQTFSAHTRFNARRVGVGLSFVNDKIGVHRNQNVQGSAAYHLKLSSTSYISMGLQAGVSIRKSNYGSVAGNAMPNDPALANSSVSQASPTVGAGVYFKSKNLQIGLSAPELIPEKFSTTDSTTITWKHAQYFLFTKVRFRISNNLDFEPGFLVKYLQGLSPSFDVNASVVIRKSLTVGAAYRRKESVDFLMKAQLTPQLQFGYAYDYATGAVSMYSKGSHELMVNYLFKYTASGVASPR